MSKALEYAKEMCVYQPIPFPEFEGLISNRTDCAKRYDAIKENYGSFKGKTMYDLCSANCYFGFRALQEGAKSVIAVEQDDNTRRFVNELAKEKGLNIVCEKHLKAQLIDEPQIDVGIYLDTHYNEGTEGYVDNIKAVCRVVFTSSCRDNAAYRVMLQKLFAHVELIYHGFQDREIFKCW